LPTIISIAKIKIPQDIHGENLLPLIVNTEHATSYDALSETLSSHLRHKKDFKLFSIRTNNWKIIKHVSTQGDKNKTELYNLIEDPAEQKNLTDKSQILSRVNPLLEKLDIFINKSKKINKKAQKPLTEKTKKALRALGYLK
jgi:arylsulfatase A-like enzyme